MRARLTVGERLSMLRSPAIAASVFVIALALLTWWRRGITPRIGLTALLIAVMTLVLGAVQWVGLVVAPEIRIQRRGIMRMSTTGVERWDWTDIRDFRIQPLHLADCDLRLLTFRTADGEFALELPRSLSDQALIAAIGRWHHVAA